MNLCLRFLWAVQARTGLRLHLELFIIDLIDERLAACCEFRSSISKFCIIVFTRSWLPEIADLETLIFGDRPVGSLRLILDLNLVSIGSWDVTKALIIDEMSLYRDMKS